MARRTHVPMDDMRISLTSMLDLVFNILAFFVMTYEPPLATKDYEVNLPPPKPAGVGEAPPKVEDFSVDESAMFNDLTVRLFADPSGTLARVLVESREVKLQGNIESAISREIQRVARAIGGIEAINLKYFPKLKYEYLVKVVEACDQTGIKKINFAGPPEEAAATP